MALHEVNLWNVDSRTGSSLDVVAAYGGLSSGRLDLPASYKKAKGFKVRVSGSHTVETYSSIAALLTGVGGRMIANLTGQEAIIEFSTTGSTNGIRGIYSVEGVFVRDWHPYAALTKGEAMSLIDTFGVDTYKWTGQHTIAASGNFNLLSLQGLGTEITMGDTTLSASSLVVLPVAVRPRGLLITVTLDGDYAAGGSGYHDFRVQLQGADGATVMQSVPLFVPNKKLEKTTATFSVFTNGVYDELSTTGFKIALVNDSATSLDLKGVAIAVQDVSNPDFTRS